MDRNHRENQGTSDFVTRFVERDGGVFFELDQPGGSGTVSLSSGPHKTLEDARAAGTKMVREILRARIAASGIGRRGERPAFVDPRVCRVPGCSRAVNSGGVFCDGCGICTRCGNDCLPHKSRLCWPCWQDANPFPGGPAGPAPRSPISVGQAALEPKATWTPPTVTTVPLDALDSVAQALADGPGGVAEWNGREWRPAELGDPMEAPALEGEQLCVCRHTDGLHMLGANSCASDHCPCVEFEAAPSVEAVQ